MLGATAGVAAASALLAWARIDDSIVGLVFLTAVVWVATRVGTWLSLYVAVLCAVSFDYFFLPPIHTLRLAGVQEWMELLSFLASTIIVSRIAEHIRKQARHAEERRADVERLYHLSQEMMLHEDAARLVRDLPRMIKSAYDLDSVELYISDQDRFYSSRQEEASPEMQAKLRALAQNHSSRSAEERDGSSLPLMLGLKNIGALAWSPDSLSRESANSMGAQVAIALTRAAAVETYTRMEAAREGERLRTALIDSLTHELRTPLTSIRAAATTLVQGDGLDAVARHDLAELMDEESRRLDKLIGEAVEMAEIDAQVLRVTLAPQYVRALFEHALEESRRVLTGHPVTIEVDNPDHPVWFDAHLLSRVLRHLIENAAKYSPPGKGIALSSRRGVGQLEFSISDHGPGIDSSDLPFIFQKFYRGKQGRIIGKGSGMGLSIVHAILEAHGGGIQVSTVQGQGTTFRFWIPLVEKQPEDTNASEAGA